MAFKLTMSEEEKEIFGLNPKKCNGGGSEEELEQVDAEMALKYVR